MNGMLEEGAVLLCFGNEPHAMVGFSPRMNKSEGQIDRCPRCGKLAEWFPFEYPDDGPLVIWDERILDG
jgi:hypothetical protein